MKNKIQGCGVALITPFTKDGSIDYGVFRKLVKRQIISGVHFLVPAGTTGEAACLTDDEKIKLLEITVAEANNKIPVVFPIIANSTKSAIDQIKMAQTIDLDGFLVITPYYNRPMQSGLYRHFRAIADSSEKPIILYNLPSCTGVNLSAETCLRLAEVENIIGVKDGSGDYRQISEIIRCAPRDFTVFSGRDNEALSLIATGAKGVISGIANVAPKEISRFIQVLLQNDFVTGRKFHHKLSPLFASCSLETNPIMVKAALHKMGLIENVLRPPLYPASHKNVLMIVKALPHDTKI